MTQRFRFEIKYVTRKNGNCPSREFYSGLSNEVKSKFISIAKAINKTHDGVLRDTDKLKKLHGKHTNDLWEMKVRHGGMWYRILCFRDNSDWMWTHGFAKNGNSTPMKEIKKGVAIKKEYEM